jgi:indole-3-glycerol phosphate synthase
MTASHLSADRAQRLAASRAEAASLAGQPVSEVTPSRRDFAQYVATQRQGLSVIARFSRAAATEDLIARAQAWDDAEVAAIAMSTAANGLAMRDFAALSDAVTAPVLRDDLTVDASQLYFARLHGADAAVFPVADLDAPGLEELVRVASSLHMASVAEVASRADVERAARLSRVLVGIRCLRGDGALDVAVTAEVARHVPARQVVICLPEIRTVDDARALRGLCDAVTVAADTLDVRDVPDVMTRLIG